MSPRHFAGVSCTWHSAGGPDTKTRQFSCTEQPPQQQPNQSRSDGGGTLLGTVQLPASLYYQLGLLDKDLHGRHLLLSGYRSAVLFPPTTAAQEPGGPLAAITDNNNYPVVSTCILGASLIGMDAFNLSEPVYVVLQKADDEGGATDVLPAWWDPRANQGLGGWSPGHCRVLKTRRDSVVFSCNRLGHYALVQESGEIRQVCTQKAGCNLYVKVLWVGFSFYI